MGKTLNAKWLPVESSNMKAVYYNKESHKLSIQFRSGGTYIYSEVDEELYGQLMEAESKGKLDCNWPNKIGINYKKLKATIFPPYMPLGEREKYRAEERKLQLNPDAKPSKFFSRWKHYIEKLNKKKFIK